MSETGLLSRVADALYWIGRYLERAEHAARVLDVHTHAAADGQGDWAPLVEVVRGANPYPANWPLDAEWVARYVVHYPGNPSSIVSALTMARENARAVRGAVSSEVWEQINTLFLSVRGDVEAGGWAQHPHAFLQAVKLGAHLFHGLAEETMLHDEGGAFLRLGKHLERIANTVSLLEARHTTLIGPDGLPDLLRCATLLRMCSAFEPYRRYYAAPVEPGRVVEFLLLNPSCPRSVLWAAARAAEDAQALGPDPQVGREVDRALGGLPAHLELADAPALAQGGLPTFLDQVRERLFRAESALHAGFFLCAERPIRPLRPLAAQQQAQQQQ